MWGDILKAIADIGFKIADAIKSEKKKKEDRKKREEKRKKKQRQKKLIKSLRDRIKKVKKGETGFDEIDIDKPLGPQYIEYEKKQ